MNFFRKTFSKIQKKLVNNNIIENGVIAKGDTNISKDISCNTNLTEENSVENDSLLIHDDNRDNNSRNKFTIATNSLTTNAIDADNFTQINTLENIARNIQSSPNPSIVNENGCMVLKPEPVESSDTSLVSVSVFNNIIEVANTHQNLNREVGLLEIEVPGKSDITCNGKEYANKPELEDKTLLENNNFFDEIKIIDDTESKIITTSNDVTCKNGYGLKTAINDQTLQNIKEFKEALSDTTFVANNSVEEIIIIDDFYDLIDKMDTDNLEAQDRLASLKVETSENTLVNIENPIINLNPRDENEIISVSSTSDIKSQDATEIFSVSFEDRFDDSDCDGYHSSDFEFISETEAQMEGFIINFNRDDQQRDLTSDSSYNDQNNEEFQSVDANSDPGEGPSGLNKRKHEFEDRSYRDNHAVPEGDDYLNLFQGIYSPALSLCEIYFMENKSTRTSAMNTMYDGLGFDKQFALMRRVPDSSEEEFEDEAKENANKILEMYPKENRKRRRRRR